MKLSIFQAPLFRISLFLLFVFLFSSCQKSTVSNTPANPPGSGTPTDPDPTKKWVVSTVAGTGSIGADDGKGLEATFNFPQNIAVDKNGNLFIGDMQNFSIRKIDADGQVSTYTSQAIANPDIAFGNIYGIVPDNQGNLFTVDAGIIRKITAPTNAPAFAGGAEITYLDGPGPDARFDQIANIAIDRSGNLYLPDFDLGYRFQIRKVTPAGMVSTLSLVDFSGYPSGNSPDISYISAIAIDSLNNIYVSGNANELVRKIDAQGNITLFAGGAIGFFDGNDAQAKFESISGIAIDPGGNVWVTDTYNHAIRRISTKGVVTTIAGTGIAGYADGDGAQAQFNYPFGIAIDKKGIVYVADQLNQRIRKIEYK